MNRRQWLRTTFAAGGVLLPTAVAAVPSRSLWDHDFSVMRGRHMAYEDCLIYVEGPLLRHAIRTERQQCAVTCNIPLHPDGRLVRRKVLQYHFKFLADHRTSICRMCDFLGLDTEIEVAPGRFEAVDIERGLLLGPVAVR